MNKNLYVITPIFNPFGYKSRYRLYRNFRKHMEDSGAKLFTIEAAFGDADFQVTNEHDPMNMQVRTNQILWHKERLINIARHRLQHVVPDCKFIGWFDADITFANPDWLAESVHQLSHLSVIQPFSTAINLDSNEDPMWNCPSTFRAFLRERGYHQHPPLPVSYTYKGHPGLAWCARREALDQLGGLYEHCVAGSADTIMANALKGDYSAFLPAPPSPGMVASMQRWSAKCNEHIKGRVGFARGSVLHHWHGASVDRGYEKRWSILSFHKFDPTVDLKLDEHGLLQWSGNKPQLEDDIRLSLGQRNEDELS